MRFSRVSILVALLCLVASVARAQDGSIIGTAIDDTKAVLPGVNITATDQETGFISTAVTNEKGEYRLLRLPPGKYTIQAELSGFSSVVLKDVELLVGNTLTIPVTMKLAQVSETLTVIGETPLVDTASSQVAGNVDRRQMEELPLQGRNWMELSKLVKGITANDVTNQPGVSRDDAFQIKLDGQQITQKVAGSGFGQPRFSRESIAEFQIASTVRRDPGPIDGHRGAGDHALGDQQGHRQRLRLLPQRQVQRRAIRSPNKVLPYQNQQVGGAGGGPIVKDKMHFFGSYEYEREPGTVVTAPAQLQIANAAPISFEVPYKNTQKSFLGRFDDQLATNDRLTIRGSRWDWDNPFVLGAGAHPSNAYISTQSATNIVGIWNKVMSGNKVQELRVGYNGFNWTRNPLAGLENGIEYNFVSLIIGGPYNYPQLFHQNNLEARYDMNWHRGAHDLKIGGEYLHVKHTGTWFIQQRGRLIFNSNPTAATLNALFPAAAWNDPSKWNLAGIATSGAVVNRFDQNFHPGGWGIDMPRPTFALWFGDTWRLNNQLTINYGVRWDDDWGVANPAGRRPHERADRQPRRARRPSTFRRCAGATSATRTTSTITPTSRRVPGSPTTSAASNSLVIRGGTGLYYSTPVSNMTFSPQIYSQMVTASFLQPAGGNCANGSLFVVDAGMRDHQLRSGEGERAGAVAAHHQPGLPESDDVAEQLRLPEADQHGDRVRGRRDALQLVSRHANDRSEPVLQPGDGLQPESGADQRGPESSQHGLYADRVFRQRRVRGQHAVVDGAQSSSAEQLPGGLDVHLHVQHARQRQHRLHGARTEQPVRLPRRRVRHVERLPAAHRAGAWPLSCAVGDFDRGLVCIRLWRAVRCEHCDRAVTGNPAPTV